MFATLLGALPRPSDDRDVDVLVRTAIRAQEQAGLEPITDGRLRSGLSAWAGADGTIDVAAALSAWRSAAGATDRAVKQALPGPYTTGRRAAQRPTAAKRAAVTMRSAESLRIAALELAAAGCPLVEIEETDAHLIGTDEPERSLFRDAHRRVTDGLDGVHLSLSIVGGSAWEAGAETILDAPYASLAVDLIDGPDNWNLVTRWPGDRGLIAGTLPAKSSPADAKELLLWAARYAAASNGRGLDRVGIGSAGSFANLTWAAAVEKLGRLGDAARLASTLSADELARQVDFRALGPRAAAMVRERRNRDRSKR